MPSEKKGIVNKKTRLVAVPSKVLQAPLESKHVPKEMLQLVLDIFSSTFSSRLNSDLSSLIQQVKKHLYDRDFDSAFGHESLLEAYAARWSPSRALAYINTLYNLPNVNAVIFPPFSNGSNRQGLFISNETHESIERKEHADITNGIQQASSRIVCIGAGAGAEIVAFGALLKCLEQEVLERESNCENALICAPAQIDVQVIDIADWGSVLSKLYVGLSAPPVLSPFASAKAKAANQALVDPSLYKLHFSKKDILNIELAELSMSLERAKLVTLMFTLNELFSSSLKGTTNFLLSLTSLLPPGALLLVLDSPGSYSTVKIGSRSDESGGKNYPMHWLLDHTLLDSPAAATSGSKGSTTGESRWEKLETHESEWFRLPKGLQYPIDLEDMRYQLHLYRRV